MTNYAAAYNPQDLARLSALAPQINGIASNAGVPSSYVMGGIFREILITRTDLYRRFQWSDPFAVSTYPFDRQLSHAEIAGMYAVDKATLTREQIRTVGDDGLAGRQFRTDHPLFWSNGFGYIKGFSALQELEAYNARFPDSDPLGLKQYNTRYDKLVTDLNDPKST